VAFQSVWYQTFIDESILTALHNQLDEGASKKVQAEVGVEEDQEVQMDIRNSSINWLLTNHWIGPLLFYYVQRANRENFRFDISHIDNESMQYTTYGPGQFYGWHRDDSMGTKDTYGVITNTNKNVFWNEGEPSDACRKLSFSLILSDSSEYEGGQFQMMNYENEMYEIPQQKGLLIIFDSTTLHRVRPIKKGTRKSLVGWVVGPRWR
jgi:hypothetical protein